MIIEIVTFRTAETTPDSQIVSAAENLIINFWKKQDGFIDAELVKELNTKVWSFIYHFEDIQKLKTGGGLMRLSDEFKDFTTVILPESIQVTFNSFLKKW